MTLETLKLLYYSLFYCFISYCTSVWGLTHPFVLDPLIKLQKKVIRAILFKDQFTHSTPLFSELQILKLNDIHSLQLLCFVFECVKGPTLHNFRDYFTPISSVHGHFTRQASQGNMYSSSILDHILTNSTDRVSQTGVIDTELSDHQLIYCTRKITRTKFNSHKNITIRSLKNYSKVPFDRFSKELRFVSIGLGDFGRIIALTLWLKKVFDFTPRLVGVSL